MQTAGSFANGGSHSTPICLFIFGKTIIHEASTQLTNGATLIKQGYNVYSYQEHINYHRLARTVESGGVNLITQHVYIHYANFLESPWLYPAPGVIDVSTAHLFHDIHLRDMNLREGKSDSLATYRTRNFTWEIRALNFLRSKQLHDLPFSVPRLLSLETKEPREVYQAELDDDFFKANQVENLKSWPREFENRINSIAGESAIEEFIARFILPRLLVLIRMYPQAFSRLSDQELSGLSLLRRLPPKFSEQELDTQLSNLYTFVSFLRKEVAAGHIFPHPEPQQYGEAITRLVRIDITAVPRETLERLFTQISHMPNGAQTFEAHWVGLSSGQAAYLRLYARLFQALSYVQERLETHHQEIKSLTIMVDEGETGFHPQWQKKYMRLLLGIVEQMFDGYQVQLIVGSNSPFIASDIPQSNLLLLHRRQEDGHSEVKSWANKEQTFAANIHTLLTDSFFLQEGLMGDFAKAKVRDLIEYLQPSDNPQADNPQDSKKETMRAVLEMIGEPVIRLKLQEMWADKFGVEERIADLQRQIIALRRQQENG